MFTRINKAQICLSSTYYVTRNIIITFAMMASGETSSTPYELVFSGKLGAVVKGICLQSDPPPAVIEKIKHDVHKYGLLVFKSQGIISGQRHVEISRWFGELESTFYKHPKSPHPDVFRVSNVASEGCTNVGRTGWHIDGSFQEAPFAYSLYHMINVPIQGDTAFISLYDLVDGLTPDKLHYWERLYMASDIRVGRVHPLVYSHPVTNKKTLCFHLGMTEAFIIDHGTPHSRMTNPDETAEILADIYSEITSNNRSRIYSHKWEAGDFIISDNLALGHEATPETQWSISKVGLRVMHRTTVAGTSTPQKNYKTDAYNKKQEL